MELMRLVLPILILPAIFAANADLVRVKSVYMLPMSNGMDQYLANHLLAADLYVVVTDPKAADAVFTDSLGPAFERKMTELYPPEKPAERKRTKTRMRTKGPSRRAALRLTPYPPSGEGAGWCFWWIVPPGRWSGPCMSRQRTPPRILWTVPPGRLPAG